MFLTQRTHKAMEFVKTEWPVPGMLSGSAFTAHRNRNGRGPALIHVRRGSVVQLRTTSQSSIGSHTAEVIVVHPLFESDEPFRRYFTGVRVLTVLDAAKRKLTLRDPVIEFFPGMRLQLCLLLGDVCTCSRSSSRKLQLRSCRGSR